MTKNEITVNGETIIIEEYEPGDVVIEWKGHGAGQYANITDMLLDLADIFNYHEYTVQKGSVGYLAGTFLWMFDLWQEIV